MKIHIQNTNEYKLYLKMVLAQYVKDKKKLAVIADEMYIAFLDGVKFGRGKLIVEVSDNG